jgi:microcompartment protein CcmL/EutN
MTDIVVIGVLELNSIATGIKVLDQIAKAAPVEIIDSRTICPGKYLIVFTGQVADVDASLTAGKFAGEGYIVDELFIPNLHRDVIPAIVGTAEYRDWNAIAVVESFSAVASIDAADAAIKSANINLVEIRLAIGLGGKSFIKMLGDIHEIEIAVKTSEKVVASRGLLCNKTIIPNPHESIKPFFLF